MPKKKKETVSFTKDLRQRPESHKKFLEDKFIEEYLARGKKHGAVTSAALAVRPDMARKSAEQWGRNVLKDSDVRERMHIIEQGGLVRIRELLDTALDTITELLTRENTSEKVRLEAAKIILQRIYGAVPESVHLTKISIFDGADKRSLLRDSIRVSVEEGSHDTNEFTDAEICSGGTEAPEAA